MQTIRRICLENKKQRQVMEKVLECKKQNGK